MAYEKIWNKVLGNGETVEYEFSIGERYTNVKLIIVGLLSLFLILYSFKFWAVIFLLLFFYYKYYVFAANAYALTNKRVLYHSGWLSSHMISVDYQKITDIHIDESFWDKTIFHAGHISIITAGTTLDQIEMRNIDNPYEVKKKLDELKDIALKNGTSAQY